LVSDHDGHHMDGTRAVAVALLVCLASFGSLSAVAMQEQGASMSVVPQDGTAEYLAPPVDGIDRDGQQTMSIDVGGAVDSTAGEVRSTYYRVSLQRSYREAETTDERRAVVRNGTSRIGERVQSLEDRERRAIERFSAGEIGERQLLRRLAVVDQDARSLERFVDWLETRADNLGLQGSEEQLSLYRARLHTLQGPVRATADSAMSGDGETRVHVETSGGGIVLATVAERNGEDTYLREVYDPTARTDEFSEPSGVGLSAAEERLRELYPWVTNNSTPTAAPVGPDDARLWRFTYSHPHGTLETYLDVETEQILLERQYKDPETIPSNATETVEGDLRLVLNRTRAGGPLGVSVYDAETGEPVDATIEMDDESVGRTDGDRLWTVAARGGTTVNATHDGETVTQRTTFG
jgi:hypothetical protein